MATVAYTSRTGRGVLLAAVLGSGMALLDSTAVNVALPAIGRDLGGGLATLQWTVDAYLLTLSALLLVGGALGDRLGRRRTFAVGLAAFALASAVCAAAPSAAALVAARALQGAAAALLTPGSLALLRATFQGADGGRAVAAWASLSALTTAAGPLLGGALVHAVSWRAIFLLNLPLAAAALAATFRCVPESRDPAAPARPDLGGAATAAAALGGIAYALIELPARGAHDGGVRASAGAGVVAAVLFFVVEARARHPMLPLGLFRSRQLAGANAATLAVYFGLAGATFLLVVELQVALGYGPLAAGASLLPATACLVLLSPPVGRAADRLGRRRFMTAGPLVVAAGLLLLRRATPGAGYASGVLPGVVLLGLGLALTVAPLTSAALEAVDERQAGLASGVNNAVARVAGLLAVALLPAVSRMPADAPRQPAALAAAFGRAMAFTAAACAAGALVAFLTIERQQAARRPRAAGSLPAPRESG